MSWQNKLASAQHLNVHLKSFDQTSSSSVVMDLCESLRIVRRHAIFSSCESDKNATWSKRRLDFFFQAPITSSRNSSHTKCQLCCRSIHLQEIHLWSWLALPLRSWVRVGMVLRSQRSLLGGAGKATAKTDACRRHRKEMLCVKSSHFF